MIASIVISVRNDRRISGVLESIFSRGIEGFNEPFEVIVVENSSTPCLAPLITKFPVTHLTEPRRGVTFAQKTGVAAATGKFIVFTDADCIVTRGWLAALLKPFTDPNVGVVGGPIIKHDPQTRVERHQRDLVIGNQRTVQYLPPLYPLPYVVTANAAFRADALSEAGGIDPQCFLCGDVDIAWRIGDLGYRVTISPDALVEHICRPTRRSVFRQFYKYSKGHALLFRKFGRARGRRYCFNPYPFTGLAKTVPAYLHALARNRGTSKDTDNVDRLAFQIIEYVALIVGAIAGSIQFRVLYI